MGLRVYCPIHKDEQLHLLVYHVGPHKGEKRTGTTSKSAIHYCHKCNMGYDVKVIITPFTKQK